MTTTYDNPLTPLRIRWPLLMIGGCFLIGLEIGMRVFTPELLNYAGTAGFAAFSGLVLVVSSVCLSAYYAAKELDIPDSKIQMFSKTGFLPDNLTLIEGIGPKFSKALLEAEIKSFKDLAETSELDLRSTLKEAGHTYTPTISTWREQASLAANQEWVRLKKFQQELTSGRKK